MLTIGYVVWAFIISYIIIAKGLPQLLSWLCYRHFKIYVKIGKIGVLSLSLKDVVIRKKDTEIAIDSVGISSSLVNRNHSKLLAIYINDVRIQKSENEGEHTKFSKSSTSSPQDVARSSSKFVLPHSLIMLSQILSINIGNINVVMLRTLPDCLVHCTIQEIKLEGSSENTLSQISLNIKNASCKLLQSLHHQANEQTLPCLAEVALSNDLIMNLDPKKEMKLKVASVQIEPEITLSEGFLTLFTGNAKSSQSIDYNDVGKNSSEQEKKKNLLCKFENLIPEIMKIDITHTKFKFLSNNHTKALSCDLKAFHINMLTPSSLLDISSSDSLHMVNVVMSLRAEDLTLNSGAIKVLALNTAAFSSKIVERKLDFDLSFSSFLIVINEEEIHFWLNMFHSKQLMISKQKKRAPQTKKSEIFHLAKQLIVEGNMELWDVNMFIHATELSPFRTGCSHMKISFNGLREDSIILTDDSAFLSNVNNIEILVEVLWYRLGESNLPENHSKKNHYWNTVFFLGMMLLTIKRQAVDFKWQGMVDNLQLEWSPGLMELLMSLLRRMKRTKSIKESEEQIESEDAILTDEINSETRETSPPPVSVSQMNLHFKFNHLNVFFLTERKVGIILRIDDSTVDIQQYKFTLALEGSKISYLAMTSNLYSPCLKSSEIKPSNVSFKQIHFTFKRETNNCNLQLLDNMTGLWNTTFHMTVIQIVNDILDLKRAIKSSFPKSDKSVVPNDENEPSMNCLLKIKGSLNFCAIISSRHKMSISTASLTVKMANKLIHAQSDGFIISFDNHDIFVFQDFTLSFVPHNEQLTVERETISNLVMKENRACLITISLVKITFPYEYLFAEAFSEETISIVKWLKIIHKKQKKEFTINSPLPRDLFIKLNKFTVEFCDDPFEVKLRDNYELLEDEYMENLKRWKMLEDSIEELRKTHLMLSAGKIEEVYANLQKKNTDVYIQRSRKMYSTTPMRTRLGFWQFTEVEIVAMADLSYHGKENVVEQMKDIDPESPYPEEDVEYSTLWCRMIRVSSNTCSYRLRDYPCPVLEMQKFYIWGRLVGAEQEANARAKRIAVVGIDEPWGNTTVLRSMPPLKFYHDFSCEIEHFTISYGPCWESAFAQMNLSMECVNKPSADPSPPLPFWDKMRLLFHGRLTMLIQHTAMVLRASLDPYNTTEEMDFSWSGLILDWTNAKIVLKGDFDVFVRTASKYDDCHFLHIPNLKLTFKLDWLCLGDPNDHHSVKPCAPDKLPEYSSNQEHDSYRAFRSLNLNMSINIETRPVHHEGNIPSMLFYSSTLRWLENLKNNMSSVSRPIKRGRLFCNCKPRKAQLGRHYKNLRFSLSFHQFEVCYWMSFAKLRGFDMKAGKLTLSSEHNLSIVPIDDGLRHRPRSEWNTAYMNCELNDTEIWLQSATMEDSKEELNMSFRTPVEKCYFLSLSRVSYGRETAVPESQVDDSFNDTPTHRLVLHDLKGAWTKNNKDIVFSMFDSYMNNKLLRRNLSTEALKGFKVDSSPNSSKSRGNSISLGMPGTSSPLLNSSAAGLPQLSRQQSSPIIVMLQQLIAEADNKAMVFSEDLTGGTREQQLHGVAACQTDDVLHKNWLIELINSQVLLKGCEIMGYVIMSAAKAQILQRIHQPTWQDCRLVTKTTWVGSLECMQYYATVDPGELNPSMDNIMWLTLDNIEEKESMVISDLPDLVGSGQGVGGVISSTVGGADPRNPVQLQRIVSRCGCQFFYASYGENVDPNNLEKVPPLTIDDDSDLWSKEVPVDSFTLTHHDLNCCTNSLQYAMLLDIVNNLLMYVEPKKKEFNEKLQRMRFQLQLSHVADQRTPILQLQNQVRTLLSNLRRLEKEIYMVQREMDEDDPSDSVFDQMVELEREIYECKVQLNAQSEELAMMIWCFKEQQLAATRKLRISKHQKVIPSRWNEVCFKHAQWRLTEADGQLGIADVVLSNFLYSKQTKTDDSVEHLLELGYMQVTNLLPNQMYKVAFQPTNLQANVPFDRQCTLRIFCREKPPVGGISIKEHFEVNVVPLTLGLTIQFYQTMLRFCFPGKETENADKQSPDDTEVDVKSRKKHSQLRRAASVEDQDDIEKMKERAEKNKMFLYIKIPEVPVKLSYKAEKEKNIKDIHDFTLVIPTLEYHNVTWTWLDLLLAMKNDSKKALLSQAIKQKLQIKSGKPSTEEGMLTQEEDKVRMLLGSKLHGPTEKKRSTLFSRSGK